MYLIILKLQRLIAKACQTRPGHSATVSLHSINLVIERHLAFYKPCNREAKSDLKKKRKRKEEEAQTATR